MFKNRGMRYLFFIFWLLPFIGCSSSDNTANNNGAVLSPPTSIVASPGYQNVKLEWLPMAGASSYNVYYSQTPGVSLSARAKFPNAHSPLVIPNLTNNVTYYFVITSVNAAGESLPSVEKSVIPSNAPLPASPTAVTAVAGDKQVTVSWHPGDQTSKYTVYYDTHPNVDTAKASFVVATVPDQNFQTVTQAVITPLTNGTTYYFVVTAYVHNSDEPLEDGEGVSAPSLEVSATPGPAPAPPASISAVEGDSSITISWPSAAGATSYNIYWFPDAPFTKKNGVKIAQVSSPYLLTGLTNKLTYFFVVTAVNQDGEGAFSSVGAATPLAPSNEPSAFSTRMTLIPGGPFQMGDNLNDSAVQIAPGSIVDYSMPWSLPVHTVNVSSFYIDKYSTTYDLWKVVYDWAVAHGYAFDSAGLRGSNGTGTNMPVSMTPWYDVVKWMNARSEMEGLTPCYYTDTAHTVIYRSGDVDLTNDMVLWDVNGYRLPTEAEWEKAARGGLAGKRYPWGDDPVNPFLIDNNPLSPTAQANSMLERATSVGIYPPNGYGLYDMGGNVWQWVWDWYANDYTWAPDGIMDPRGPATGTTGGITVANRIRRGGSFETGYGPRYLRCADKMNRPPNYQGPYFGFRSARSKL